MKNEFFVAILFIYIVWGLDRIRSKVAERKSIDRELMIEKIKKTKLEQENNSTTFKITSLGSLKLKKFINSLFFLRLGWAILCYLTLVIIILHR